MKNTFGRWLDQARMRTSLTQQDVARRLSQVIGYDRSQGWVSRVELGRADPSGREVVLLAAIVGADPVEALKVAGLMEEPPLTRIEAKLDNLLELVGSTGRP